MNLRRYLRLGVIVGPLPITLLDGQIADAAPVMANFNWIVSQVNTNAAAGTGSGSDVQVVSTSSPSLTSGLTFSFGTGATIVKDALNEFSTVTGVFTAQAAGVYLCSAMISLLTNGCTFNSASGLSRVGSAVVCTFGAIAAPANATNAGTWPMESVTLAIGGTINFTVNSLFTGGPAKIGFAQLAIVRIR